MTTYHQILGTTEASTAAEIKKRYRQLSSQCHPDKGGSNELFKLIGEAYKQVCNGNGNGKAFNAGGSRTEYKTEYRDNPAQQAKINTLLEQLARAKIDLQEAKQVAIDKHKLWKEAEEKIKNFDPYSDIAASEDNTSRNAVIAVLLVAVGLGTGISIGQDSVKPTTKYVRGKTVEKVVYKDKIIYKYKDRVEYRERGFRAKDLADKSFAYGKWFIEKETGYLATYKEGQLLTMQPALSGKIYLSYRDSSDKLQRCGGGDRFINIDNKSSRATLQNLKDGTFLQCSPSSPKFSLSGFMATHAKLVEVLTPNVKLNWQSSTVHNAVVGIGDNGAEIRYMFDGSGFQKYVGNREGWVTCETPLIDGGTNDYMGLIGNTIICDDINTRYPVQGFSEEYRNVNSRGR